MSKVSYILRKRRRGNNNFRQVKWNTARKLLGNKNDYIYIISEKKLTYFSTSTQNVGMCIELTTSLKSFPQDMEILKT